MKQLKSEFIKDAPIDSIFEHPENPRLHDDAALEESITTIGFYGAPVVQKSTKFILAGNGRWAINKKLGATTISYFELDVDDETAKRILLADNRTNDKAGYDKGKLVALLESLAITQGELFGTGYTGKDMDDFQLQVQDVKVLPVAATDATFIDEENETEVAERKVKLKSEKAVVREMMLVYPELEYNDLISAIKHLAKHYEVKGAMPTVQRAVLDSATASGWVRSSPVQAPDAPGAAPSTPAAPEAGPAVAIDAKGQRSNLRPKELKVGDIVTIDLAGEKGSIPREIIEIKLDSTQFGSGVGVKLTGPGGSADFLDAAWAIPANEKLPLEPAEATA